MQNRRRVNRNIQLSSAGRLSQNQVRLLRTHFFCLSLESEDTPEHEEDLEKKFEVNGLSLSLQWSSPRSLLEKPPLTAGTSIRTEKDFNYSKIHQIGSGVAELNAMVIPGDSKLSCY